MYLSGVKEYVDSFFPVREMSALNKERRFDVGQARTYLSDDLLGCGDTFRRYPKKDTGLWQIGCYQSTQGEQFVLNDFEGIARKQRTPGCGGHDGVIYHGACVRTKLRQIPHDSLDVGSIGQHSDFYMNFVEVRQNSFELRLDYGVRNRVNRRDARRILSRHGCNYIRTVTTQSRKCLYVCLNACSAA